MQTKMSRHSSWVLCIAFVVMIVLPMILQTFVVQTDQQQENRELARLPTTIEWRKPDEFIEKFDAYFQDNFGWRAFLIDAHARYKTLFGISPSEKVIIGTDGWLFFTGNKVIENYRGLRPFDEVQLERQRQYLEAKSHWLAAQGIHYIYMAAPDKHTIYGEYIPSRFNRESDVTRLDLLTRYLSESSTFSIVDPRAAMVQAKSGGRLYHKTDSHWNLDGAFVGYEVLTDHIEKQFPQFRGKSVDDYTKRWVMGRQGDLGQIVGIEGVYRENRVEYQSRSRRCAKVVDSYLHAERFSGKGASVVATECVKGSLHVVLFHDSFGLALINFLKEDFRHMDHVNRRFNVEALEDLIRTNKPDLVLEVSVERLVGRIPTPEEIEDLQGRIARLQG
jgi:hypothetical protein